MRLFVFLIASLLTGTCFGQTIDLKYKKAESSIKVASHGYTLYFQKNDLILGLTRIDSTLKTNSTSLIQAIKDGHFQSSNSQDVSLSLLTEALKANLGCYLLFKGLAGVEKDGKSVATIVGDESPEMQGLDGANKTAVFFSEKGNENPIFIGEINSKVKSLK